MAWNPTTNTLTRGFVKIAANGQGDLQLALRRSVMKHSLLVCDIDANGNRVNAINPASRYKPFCHSNNTFADAAAWDAARVARNCGLVMKRYTALSAMWSAALALSPDDFCWVYEPPRSSQTSEPKRADDFVDIGSDTKGYNSTAKFQFGYRLLPNPMTRWTVPPKVNLPPDVLLTANAIDVSDLQGDGTTGYTGQDWGYYNISDFYFGVAIAERGASGPQWIKCFQTSDIPLTVDYFDSVTSTKDYDVVFFFFKPQQSGGAIYNGGSAALPGTHVLAPQPYTQFHYDYSLGISTTAIMNAARNTISLTISATASDIPYHHIALVWQDGLTTRTASFTNTAGTITSTPASFSASYASGWPVGTSFIIRIYTSSSAYKEQSLPVMEQS